MAFDLFDIIDEIKNGGEQNSGNRRYLKFDKDHINENVSLTKIEFVKREPFATGSNSSEDEKKIAALPNCAIRVYLENTFSDFLDLVNKSAYWNKDVPMGSYEAVYNDSKQRAKGMFALIKAFYGEERFLEDLNNYNEELKGAAKEGGICFQLDLAVKLLQIAINEGKVNTVNIKLMPRFRKKQGKMFGQIPINKFGQFIEPYVEGEETKLWWSNFEKNTYDREYEWMDTVLAEQQAQSGVQEAERPSDNTGATVEDATADSNKSDEDKMKSLMDGMKL